MFADDESSLFSQESMNAAALEGMDRIYDLIKDRRQLMQAQIAASDIQSKLCDEIKEAKDAQIEKRIKILEEIDPRLYEYIRYLETVKYGIWCNNCNSVKRIPNFIAENKIQEDNVEVPSDNSDIQPTNTHPVNAQPTNTHPTNAQPTNQSKFYEYKLNVLNSLNMIAVQKMNLIIRKLTEFSRDCETINSTVQESYMEIKNNIDDLCDLGGIPDNKNCALTKHKPTEQTYEQTIRENLTKIVDEIKVNRPNKSADFDENLIEVCREIESDIANFGNTDVLISQKHTEQPSVVDQQPQVRDDRKPQEDKKDSLSSFLLD